MKFRRGDVIVTNSGDVFKYSVECNQFLGSQGNVDINEYDTMGEHILDTKLNILEIFRFSNKQDIDLIEKTKVVESLVNSFNKVNILWKREETVSYKSYLKDIGGFDYIYIFGGEHSRVCYGIEGVSYTDTLNNFYDYLVKQLPTNTKAFRLICIKLEECKLHIFEKHGINQSKTYNNKLLIKNFDDLLNQRYEMIINDSNPSVITWCDEVLNHNCKLAVKDDYLVAEKGNYRYAVNIKDLASAMWLNMECLVKTIDRLIEDSKLGIEEDLVEVLGNLNLF